jgi:hypothetical protein
MWAKPSAAKGQQHLGGVGHVGVAVVTCSQEKVDVAINWDITSKDALVDPPKHG